MSNTSATGGYLSESQSAGYPGGLSLTQFIQSVFVGISGLQGQYVRPLWQIDPPKQPDITCDWMAIGITDFDVDANAYVGMDSNQNTNLIRHQTLDVQCSIYGPNCYENTSALIDRFQIQQNLESLKTALMGFVGVSKPMRIPELVGERWCDRYQLTFTFRKQNIRTYPVLFFTSANGQINTRTNAQNTVIDWTASITT